MTRRCTGRGHGLTGRVRSVHAAVRRAGVRVLHRRVRSLAGPARPVRRPEGTEVRKVDRTRGASGHTRSDTSGRCGSLLDSNRTLVLSRPVIAWIVSSHCFAGARYCVIGASGQLSGASGHLV
jgi:hypothetical protein